MKTANSLYFALTCTVLAVLVTACVSGPTSPPTPTIKVIVVATLAPALPTSTATPTPPPTASVIVQECPINSLQTSYVQDRIFIEPSDRGGWCKVALPLESYKTIGYSLIYPENWIVTLAGAEGMNLHFNTQRRQGVFIQLTTHDLPLERADEATYGFELSGPHPLVEADENQTSKAIQTIGEKQVLVLLTSKDDVSIKRYFLLHSNTLYMFRVKMSTVDFDTGETIELLVSVEEMITSMQFVR